MISAFQFQQSCHIFSHNARERRGGIYTGEGQILGKDLVGHQLLIDSRHFSDLKTFYVPPLLDITIQAILYHLVQPGMRCLEVGTGCGYYSLYLASLVKQTGQIYGFEANPTYFTFLKKNIKANDLNWITPIQSHIDDSSASLDDHFKENPQMDLCKINPIDSLPSILKGMKKLIRTNPKIKIICRTNSQKAIEDLVQDGFIIYHIPEMKIIEAEEIKKTQETKTLLLSRNQIITE